MSVPKSVVKFKRNGVEFTSSVDRAAYTITELTRAALRDVGRYISRQCNAAGMKLPGMRRNRRVRGKTSAFQFWVRRQEGDLQVGIKHATWYGVQQELGTHNQPRREILRRSTEDNIATIVQIESQYLSALEDEARALQLINEDEYQGGGGEDNQ